MPKKISILVNRLQGFLGLAPSESQAIEDMRNAPAVPPFTLADAEAFREFLATPAGAKFRDACRHSIRSHLPTGDMNAYSDPFMAGANAGYAKGVADMLDILEVNSGSAGRFQNQATKEESRY